MSVVTPKQQRSPTPSLNYRSCYVVELRHFLQNRTTLPAKAIQKLNKAKMVSRLTKLDTQRTFSRFMDLPPELRLGIYQRVLLIDGKESGKNHAALLRVSRLIHSESEPVLYCGNSFLVQVNRGPVMKWAVSDSWKTEWDLSLPRVLVRPNYTPPPPVKVDIDMLLGLRHLTMRLCDPEELRGREVYYHRRTYYPCVAENSFTIISLMLSSAARLKTLTITNVPQQDSFWDVDELTRLLYPVIFLQKSAAIKVEGGSLALHTALENSRRHIHSHPTESLSSYDILLSKAIMLLAKTRRELESRTSTMLLVALICVFGRIPCLSERDLRNIVARLKRLRSVVEGIKVALAVVA